MINIPKNSMKKTLKQYLFEYKSSFEKQSFESFHWLILAIISVQEVRSVKFLYENFIEKYCDKTLNCFYYFLSYLEFSVEKLMRSTVRIVLSLIPDSLDQATIFLTIDDTLQPKFGNKFDCYYKLFDHVQRTGNSYLNGHCFVSLVINIPLAHQERIKYLSIPVGYKLYSKDKSKLEISANLIENIMPLLKEKQVIVLSDSWYSKGAILDTVKKYDNLDFIGAVRKDTAIYDLPPEHDGTRGRPRKYGDRLDVKEFSYQKEGQYFIAHRKVMTRLFDEPVHLTVTVKDIEKFSSIKLHISTINSETITAFDEYQKEKESQNQDKKQRLSLKSYDIRWNIEVIFYEHKTFWSFDKYMLRNKEAIERYVNLLSIAYTFVSVLPFLDSRFEEYKFSSPQLVRRKVAERIRQELIFDSFVATLENSKIYSKISKAVDCFLRENQAA